MIAFNFATELLVDQYFKRHKYDVNKEIRHGLYITVHALDLLIPRNYL